MTPSSVGGLLKLLDVKFKSDNATELPKCLRSTSLRQTENRENPCVSPFSGSDEIRGCLLLRHAGLNNKPETLMMSQVGMNSCLSV